MSISMPTPEQARQILTTQQMWTGIGGVSVIMALIKVIEHMTVQRFVKPNGNGKCHMKDGDSAKLSTIKEVISEKEDGTPMVYFPRRVVDDAHREQLAISRDIAQALAETAKSQERIVEGQAKMFRVVEKIESHVKQGGQ